MNRNSSRRKYSDRMVLTVEESFPKTLSHQGHASYCDRVVQFTVTPIIGKFMLSANQLSSAKDR